MTSTLRGGGGGGWGGWQKRDVIGSMGAGS